jgi:hypothetical protein
MELGPQRTCYPSPDEQRMNTWWNYIWDRRRSKYLEKKLFQGRFFHPERSEKTCDKPYGITAHNRLGFFHGITQLLILHAPDSTR